MACIVYQTDKRTGIKYAYESVSYWDPEKKQPRSKRKYLGRVDPETNEIITGRKKKNVRTGESSAFSVASDAPTSAETISPDLIKEKDAEISALRRENIQLKKEKEEILSILSKILKEFPE